MEAEARPEIIGIASKSGVTFATEANVMEAITRGKGDPKNPFVANICNLFFSNTVGGITSATVTQIAPGIFMCPKHTADTYLESLKYFNDLSHPERLGKREVGVNTGNGFLTQPHNIGIAMHPEVDLALLKPNFKVGILPTCDFPLLADSLKTGESGNGFVVSFCDISIINNEKPFGFGRTLSIHTFKTETEKQKNNLIGIIVSPPSGITRKVVAEQKAELRLANESYKINPSDENLTTVKNMLTTIPLTLPAVKNSSPERLMSVLDRGASGSPLIVKQGGVFKLMGMFTESVDIGNYEDATMIRYNKFIDLTVHKEWIVKKIAEM